MSSEEYLNSTVHENDPFDEVDLQELEYMSRYHSIFYTITHSLGLILYLVVLAADIFLICVICKFRRLKTRLNMYILNCAILNILQIVSAPFLGLTVWLINVYYPLSSCIVLELPHTLTFLYVAYAFTLSLDWFVSNWKPHLIQKYNKHYKYAFIGLYALFLSEGLIEIYMCLTGNRTVFSLFGILYIIALIVVAVINILNKKMNLSPSSKETAYSLTVTNIVFFSFVPMLLFYILEHYVSIFGTIHYVLLYLELIPLLILIGHPIFIVYMLGRQNKHFKMAYQQCFKKSLKEYGGDNLDEESDVENDSNKEAKVRFSSDSLQTEVVP